MAEIQSIKEDFLTCSICTEIYIDPCTLACQHSYCRKCVTDYIKTQPESLKSKTIPCAMCRQVTPVPNPSRPVEEWAKQLRPSLMLQGLMDKLHSGHKHVEGDRSCFLCNEVGETSPASHWCFDCEITLCSRCARMHLRAPSSKDHDVSDQDVRVKSKGRSKDSCREHGGEKIKSICHDCNKAVCQTCCITKHKACTHVVTIESLIPEIKSALKEKRRILGEKKEASIAAERSEKYTVEQLKTCAIKIGEEIKSTTESAVILLRSKEKDLLKELNEASDKQIMEHQANLKSSKITTQVYQQHCEFIDQAIQSESKVDMYDMYLVCLSGSVESVGNIESDTRNTPIVGELKYRPNMGPLKKAIAEMGVVDAPFMTGETPLTASTAGSISLLKPVLYDEVSYQYGHSEAYQIDVTVLNIKGENTIVAIVSWCDKLESMYTKNGKKTTSSLQLPGEPRGLTKIPGNQVVASLSKSYIVVAEVRPELSLLNSYKTTKQYEGMGSLPDLTLAASVSSSNSESHAGVDILDMGANVLRSFTADSTGLELLKNPGYLCITHENNILVTDKGSKSVYCLTSKGKIVFSYTPSGGRALTIPKGITVTETGGILVVDSANRILLLSSDGKYVKDILTSTDGISYPFGLHCDGTNKVYVSQRHPGQIKVFEFK